MSVHDADYKKVKKALGVPEDEPIFVIRGQDILAVPAIARYESLARMIEKNQPDEEWFKRLAVDRDVFVKWQSENKNRVKIPD